MKNKRGFTVVELLICIGGVAMLGLIITLLCVLAHFVSKFW